jgi:hypothetical protein
MKKWMNCIAYLAVAAALSACSQKGSEFVGTWEAVKSAKHRAVIERNGDNFLIKDTEPSMTKRGETNTTTLAGVYKDGALEVSGPFGPTSIAYVKQTDTLVWPTMGGSLEYRRVK